MSEVTVQSLGPAPGAQAIRDSLQALYDSFRITQLNGVESPYGLSEFAAGVRTFLSQLEALEAPVTTSRKARKQE